MAMRKEDRQKVYNIVRDHLLAQGERAHDPMQQTCMYRFKRVDDAGIERTLKCAAGCLIADEAYSPALEQTTVTKETPSGDMLRAAIKYSLQAYDIDVDSRRVSADMLFLRGLQMIHDAENRTDRWPELLKQFAKQQELIP